MSRSSVFLSLLVGLACSNEPTATVTVKGLEFSTTYSPQADTLGEISGAVRIYNPSRRPVTITLRSPCTLVLRAYRLDVANTAAWDQARKPGGCKSFPLEVVVRDRATRTFPFGPIEASDILGDSLPTVPYELTVFIARLDGAPSAGIELQITTAVFMRQS